MKRRICSSKHRLQLHSGTVSRVWGQIAVGDFVGTTIGGDFTARTGRKNGG